MATIAKGSITLVNVNDAYSVLSTPDSCVINAAFDGTSPNLDAAFTDITVVRGETKHTYKIELSKMSSSKITYQLSSIDAYTKRIKLTSIPSDALSGYVTFTVTTDDEYVADVTFQYSVVRETSMLDWILDWESNKTVIGDTYLITPKIFVGKKVENEAGMATLTGVYIGPDDTNTAGIYGYKEGEDVFHINANGAMIGGWDINSGGISTSNEYGSLQILSEGTLQFLNTKGDAIWKIWKDGSAEFSQGNVCFYENGNAYFAGEISADLGQIGGWKILTNSLFNSNIILDSAKHLIGIYGANATDEIFMIEDVAAKIQQNGGVYLYYNNIADYGLRGYMPQRNEDGVDKPTLGFSLGSTNQIANWCFDDTALYMGTKNNMTSQYTDAEGSITIGSNGMRGYGWYIDSDGSISFVSGGIQFTKDGGVIVGWDLHQNRLSTDYVAIVSDSADAGIYMSVAGGFHTLASSSMADYIGSNGGIYMKVKPDDVSFAAYYSDGEKIFELRSNGVSSIAEWNIESDALFVGTKNTSSGAFTSEAGSITISSTGIRGNKWRLEADGSGSLAGDLISWNADGEIDFKAKVSADNITAGTISACTIQSNTENPTWQLNQNGSGYLANGSISWETNGDAKFSGKIKANSGTIGDIEIHDDHIGVASTATEEGDATWSALSIYKDFFKVGGNKGYVMFGNDVIPGSAGGAFTAVGRIVNHAPNTQGGWAFDQANYGLFIDVTGGTKNYGISSNAALMAPAFVNTKAQILTFDPNATTYSIDFSQANIILMYFKKNKSAGLELTLPTESSIAHKFGLSTLPNDFATIVTFRVREGSLPITLKGIYNHNEGLVDYELVQGDSVIVLISKIDGFRYQIINYSA